MYRPSSFLKFYSMMFGEMHSYNGDVARYKLFVLLKKLDIIKYKS